uniref:Dynein heavy chain hydrolytic ATP-binding dynein motor region domain-containing protein n=1 Tax=Ditylenchus dipsaci TaxID=166011 RepID=A0A915D4R6_9BILA
MLFSQGFQTAETLAKKIVPLFTLCKEQLSDQYHYDFGLRALKYVLVSAGNIKRAEIQRISKDQHDKGTESQERDIASPGLGRHSAFVLSPPRRVPRCQIFAFVYEDLKTPLVSGPTSIIRYKNSHFDVVRQRKRK